MTQLLSFLLLFCNENKQEKLTEILKKTTQHLKDPVYSIVAYDQYLNLMKKICREIRTFVLEKMYSGILIYLKLPIFELILQKSFIIFFNRVYGFVYINTIA